MASDAQQKVLRVSPDSLAAAMIRESGNPWNPNEEIAALVTERDKFERWFLGAAQERDKAQEFCEALARGNYEFMQFIEAAEEARVGHSARLFGMLDAMKGKSDR